MLRGVARVLEVGVAMVGLHDGQAPGQLLILLIHDSQDAHVPWSPLAQGLQPAGQVSQHMVARESDNV